MEDRSCPANLGSSECELSCASEYARGYRFHAEECNQGTAANTSRRLIPEERFCSCYFSLEFFSSDSD